MKTRTLREKTKVMGRKTGGMSETPREGGAYLVMSPSAAEGLAGWLYHGQQASSEI